MARRDWRTPFLEAFRNSGNVRAACEAAGIGRSAAYKARKTDPEFRAAWDDAKEDAFDFLLAAAWSRATAKQGGSDYLLWKLLQLNRPSLYGDKLP